MRVGTYTHTVVLCENKLKLTLWPQWTDTAVVNRKFVKDYQRKNIAE